VFAQGMRHLVTDDRREFIVREPQPLQQTPN
jgi:hypothetical protein